MLHFHWIGPAVLRSHDLLTPDLSRLHELHFLQLREFAHWREYDEALRMAKQIDEEFSTKANTVSMQLDWMELAVEQ